MSTLRSKNMSHSFSENEYSAESFILKYKYPPLVMMKSTSKEKLANQYIWCFWSEWKFSYRFYFLEYRMSLQFVLCFCLLPLQTFFNLIFLNVPCLKKRDYIISRQCLYNEAFQQGSLSGKKELPINNFWAGLKCFFLPFWHGS